MAKIVIEIDTGIGDRIEDVMAELGFFRPEALPPPEQEPALAGSNLDQQQAASNLSQPYGQSLQQTYVMPETLRQAHVQAVNNLVADTSGENPAPGEPAPAAEIPAPVDGVWPDGRKVGEPAAGRHRRTAEQVAMDAAFKTAPKTPSAPKKTAPDIEALVPPPTPRRAPPVNEADEAQDRAHEAQETAARSNGPATIEHLRAAIARYTAKHGGAATVKNIRGIIGSAVADVAPERMHEAILAVDAATNGGEAQAEPSSAHLFGGARRPATQTDVVEAIKEYGRRYDGSIDPDRMHITKQDLPQVFSRTFGAGVTGMGTMPLTPDALGEIVEAIRNATNSNAFNRRVLA